MSGDGEDWSKDEGAALSGRWLAAAGRAVGRDGTAAAAAPEAPAGLPQPAGAGPLRDGRDLLRAAHGLSVECAAGDDALLLVLRTSTLPGMGPGRGVRGVLARGAAGLRCRARHRLDVAGAGWGDGQGAARRGGKPARTRRTAANAGASARC